MPSGNNAWRGPVNASVLRVCCVPSTDGASFDDVEGAGATGSELADGVATGAAVFPWLPVEPMAPVPLPLPSPVPVVAIATSTLCGTAVVPSVPDAVTVFTSGPPTMLATRALT